MNTLLKLIAAATALGLVPAAAVAQDASAPPAQTLPAQPEEVSVPPLASGGEAPSDAAVAQSLASESTVAPTTGVATIPRARPEPGIGQPDGRMGIQEQFTPIGEEAAWFHDWLLMPVITAISLFVLALMIWVVIRYRRSANPVPSRTTHNTLLEVVWTLVPVLVLVVIAVPSIKLLANQYDPPQADVTVKVIGNQWYWTYQYPDHGGFELISNQLSDEEAAAAGEPRMLAVDERMVVPAGATVKLIITSNDVIHAFGVPAFWVKMDAVPGRLNETWFKVEEPGLYYGQCYELCGARHAYMPIAVEVVPPAQFAAWVASKGGTMPGAQPPVPDELAAERTLDDTDVTSTPEIGPLPPAIDAVTVPPVSTQGAAESKRGSE